MQAAAGLAWNGNGRLPLQLSGVIVAVIALLLLTVGRRLEAHRTADGEP